MESIGVTREIVKEAADIGIGQLPGLHAPKQFNELHDRNWGYQTGADLAFKGKTLEDFLADPNYTAFGEAASLIIDLAYLGYTNPYIRVTLKHSNPIRRAKTEERFAGQHHIDDDTIERGFSILCAVGPASDEVLHSAGRRPDAHIGDFQQLPYQRGSILMAQKDFGERITSNPLGRTWHTGLRNFQGKLIIVDVSDQKLPRSVVPS